MVVLYLYVQMKRMEQKGIHDFLMFRDIFKCKLKQSNPVEI